MTVQTMDSITPEAPVEQPGAAAPAPAQEQPQNDQTQAEKPEGGQEPAEKKEAEQPKKGVQKRFDELTFKVHQAQREAAYWKERATQQSDPSKDAPKPARADFADDEAFVEALTDWKTDQKLNAHSQQTATERQHEAEARESATRFDLYQQRVNDSAEAMPDYHEVVGKSDVPAAPHVLESILDSDQGPALAYHLAKNPDVAAQLNDMTPLQAAREIGRLEAQLAQPKADPTPEKRTTKAPAPINPVRGGNGQFQKSAEQMTDAEWYASQRK